MGLGRIQDARVVFAELHRLWIERERQDEYFGTLVNAYLARGGKRDWCACGTDVCRCRNREWVSGGNENDGSRV